MREKVIVKKDERWRERGKKKKRIYRHKRHIRERVTIELNRRKVEREKQ